MQAHFETGSFMGTVLVGRSGKVLHSGGYGMANLEHEAPNTPQTIFRLASLTKPFTAAAVLQLQEQGLLNVNDPVARYLPDYPHGSEITIHQLLNHTSGTPDYAAFSDHSVNFREPVSLDGLIDAFSGLPLEFPPGSQFTYSNSGYVVLTAIIETVSGQGYADYMAEHFFWPLGMDSTGFEDSSAVLPQRASGYTWDGAVYHNAEYMDISNASGAGGLVSNVIDMYKWDQALYSDAVLGEEARQAYFSPSVQIEERAKYAYGGAIYTVNERTYTLFNGEINGFIATSLRYPPDELFVVVLSNVEGAPTQAIAQGLVAIALGDPYTTPGQRTAIVIDPALYEKYTGTYQISPEVNVTITTEAGNLFAQASGEQRIEVFPESETDYFANVQGNEILIRFQLGEDGSVTGLTIIQGGQEIQAERDE